MPDDAGQRDGDALAQAQETIARQAAEIARLRRQQAGAELAIELRAAVTLAMTAGTIASPVSNSRLLDLIVETAARVIGARAASLLLVDEAAQELLFAVALGPKADAVRELRVPLGHGIAGLVAVSGQPMAVADAAGDPRQAADVARRVGYAPQSLLCVPLLYRDRVVGVLELLDKEGASSFGADDLGTLGLFAEQAAVAIVQSRTHDSAVSLLGELIADLGGPDDARRAALQQRADAFASGLDDAEDVDYREALELATLVQEIAWQGERATAACRTILQGFAAYLRSRHDPLAQTEVGA